VCHVAFDRPAVTRKDRAKKVRATSYFAKYGDAARAVLDALLDKYADEGVDDIEDIQMLKVRPLTAMGTPSEIIARFGGKDAYVKAVRELEGALYESA
jgi:type I restriction enzyme R subunit